MVGGRFAAGGGGGGGSDDTDDAERSHEELRRALEEEAQDTEEQTTDTSTDDTSSGAGVGFSPGGLSPGDTSSGGSPDPDRIAPDDVQPTGSDPKNVDTDQIRRDVEAADQQQDRSVSEQSSGLSPGPVGENINPDTDQIGQEVADEQRRQQIVSELVDEQAPEDQGFETAGGTLGQTAARFEKRVIEDTPGIDDPDDVTVSLGPGGTLRATVTQGGQRRRLQQYLSDVEASLEEEVSAVRGTDVDLRPVEDFTLERDGNKLVATVTDEFAAEEAARRQANLDVSSIDIGGRGDENQLLPGTLAQFGPGGDVSSIDERDAVVDVVTPDERARARRRARRDLDQLQVSGEGDRPLSFAEQFERSAEQETVDVRVPDFVPFAGGERFTFGGQARNVEVVEGDAGTLRTVEGDERFGDLDVKASAVAGLAAAGAFGPLAPLGFVTGRDAGERVFGDREFEDVTAEVGEDVIAATQEFGAGANIARPEPTIVREGDGTAKVQFAEELGVSEGEKTGIETYVEDVPSGAGVIVDQALNLPQESLEFGLEAVEETEAGRGGRFAGDVTDAAAGAAVSTGKVAAERPFSFAGQLTGSAIAVGAGIGAARAVGGPGAARLASLSVQPGEEAAIIAAQRGLVPSRLATKVPGVRGDQIGDVDASGVSLRQRSGDVAADLNQRRPTVRVEQNPERPFIEISDEFKPNIRGRLPEAETVSPGRLYRDVEQTALRARRDVGELPGRARDFATDLRFDLDQARRAGRMRAREAGRSVQTAPTRLRETASDLRTDVEFDAGEVAAAAKLEARRFRRDLGEDVSGLAGKPSDLTTDLAFELEEARATARFEARRARRDAPRALRDLKTDLEFELEEAGRAATDALTDLTDVERPSAPQSGLVSDTRTRANVAPGPILTRPDFDLDLAFDLPDRARSALLSDESTRANVAPGPILNPRSLSLPEFDRPALSDLNIRIEPVGADEPGEVTIDADALRLDAEAFEPAEAEPLDRGEPPAVSSGGAKIGSNQVSKVETRQVQETEPTGLGQEFDVRRREPPMRVEPDSPDQVTMVEQTPEVTAVEPQEFEQVEPADIGEAGDLRLDEAVELDRGVESRTETPQEFRSEFKIEQRTENKLETRLETRRETKVEVPPETRTESLDLGIDPFNEKDGRREGDFDQFTRAFENPVYTPEEVATLDPFADDPSVEPRQSLEDTTDFDAGLDDLANDLDNLDL